VFEQVLSLQSGKARRSRESNAWRCDPHPAWSRDYRWIAFNGRPAGGERQVMIAYLGDENDIEELFRHAALMHP
jgi:Tol biopolymer transport system component